MKEKGFSLVELLAVIVVLGFIVTIAVPLINNSIVKSKEKALKEQVDQIIKASKKYALENSNVLPDQTSGTKKVTIQTLIDNKFIETDKVVNPLTDETMNGCVTIEYMVNNIEYYYTYQETCPM